MICLQFLQLFIEFYNWNFLIHFTNPKMGNCLNHQDISIFLGFLCHGQLEVGHTIAILINPLILNFIDFHRLLFFYLIFFPALK